MSSAATDAGKNSKSWWRQETPGCSAPHAKSPMSRASCRPSALKARALPGQPQHRGKAAPAAAPKTAAAVDDAQV